MLYSYTYSGLRYHIQTSSTYKSILIVTVTVIITQPGPPSTLLPDHADPGRESAGNNNYANVSPVLCYISTVKHQDTDYSM